MWDGKGKRLRKLAHHPEQAVLAFLLRKDVLLRGGKEAQPCGRRTRQPPGPVEAVEQSTANLVLLQHRRDCFLLVDRRLPRPAALGVGGECGLQLVREPEVVHHEAARLVAEDAVHARDRLHEPMPAHRLVHIHRVQ